MQGEAVAYARPHELEVLKVAPEGDGLLATVTRVLVSGVTARVELASKTASTATRVRSTMRWN